MNIVTEGMIARPNMSLRGGKDGGFRRKKRRWQKEVRVQKNDRNKVTVSGKSVEGGNEGKVCTCWRNDDVKRGRDEKERDNVVWGWSKGDEGIMEEGMRKRVKVSKREKDKTERLKEMIKWLYM